MRNKILSLCILLTLFALCAVSGQANAQEMSRKERKEWKRKLKKISPEQYKKFLDEFKELKSQDAKYKSEISDLKGQVQAKATQLDSEQSESKRLADQIASLKKQLKAKTSSESANGIPQKFSKGVSFRVQIGAFRNKDLSKYFNNNENFGGEINKDGTQQITLGVFRDYWNANTFKKYLREMGVNDAWIVAYKNGSRVPMKDVLEGVI